MNSGLASNKVVVEGHIKTVHTSNIANVAYENCKILEQFGFPVELYCHDMTHIMSQPEWDDLDLDSKDFPDENNFYSHMADLGGYKRPSWFHSGSLLNLLLEHADDNSNSEEREAGECSNGVISDNSECNGDCISLSINSERRGYLGKKYSKAIGAALWQITPFLRKLPSSFIRILKFAYYRLFQLLVPGSRSSLPTMGIKSVVDASKKLGKEWVLTESDCENYVFHSQWMDIAARRADVIFAYVLSPIYALFNHQKAYVAVEIGTMRDIPFEGTARGKLLAQAYREADYVLITNPDVREKAELLELKHYDFCPHPIDEDRYKPLSAIQRTEIRKKLFDVTDHTLVMFAPARQNWAVKGNDKYFRALKQCVDNKMDVKLVIPGWGQEIKRSKKYCNNLGINKNVEWVRPVSEGGLIKYFSSVDIVLDQFELGVFGLITPKAMSCGAVVITSYDPELNEWCFKEAPPLKPASTDHDIFTHISELYNDRRSLKRNSEESRQWIIREHSKHRVKDTLQRAAEIASINFSARMRTPAGE